MFGLIIAFLAILDINKWGLSSESLHILGLATVFIVGRVYVFSMRPFGGAVLVILSWVVIGVTVIALLSMAFAGGGPRQTSSHLFFLGLGLTAIISWLAGGIAVLSRFIDLISFRCRD